MTDFRALAEAYDGEGRFAEFRGQAIKVTTVAILVVAFAISWASLILTPQDDLQPVLPLLGGLVLTATLAYGALSLGTPLATATMSIGLVATLTAAINAYPGEHLGPWFCLIVLSAVSAGGWRWGLATGALSAVAVLAVLLDSSDRLSPQAAMQTLLLICGVLFLAWLAIRQLQTVSEWAWRSYSIAQTKTEEARHRQAELGRLSKSLEETCRHLERLNRDLAEARALADKARKLKAEFAATVGHELRTPVNLIIGLCELMAERDRDPYSLERLPESYREDLEVVHRNAQHISQLVDDLLDLSQVDARRMALNKHPIHLPEIVSQAVACVDGLYATVGLSLTVEVPSDLPPIVADPLRIRQILINLLHNAVRFTNRGGVTISARQDASEVVLAVSDTGIGVPKAELLQLFEDFHQAQSASRGRSGSGLGLAICKRFVELHGGSIWVESTPGRGSTFYFSLPVHGKVVSGSGRSWPTVRPVENGHQRRLGVIDRTGDAVRLLQRYLDGYEVLAVNASELAAAPSNDHPDAVLLPSVAERQLWARLCRQTRGLETLPTVFCPLRTRDSLARALGVVAYLIKPISKEQLARVFMELGHEVHRAVVVEDDDEMRALVVRTLGALAPNMEVAHAPDGEAGLQLVRDVKPDVILLDLVLPKVDGYAVLERLRAEESLREIPVIVVTGRGLDEEVVVDAIEIRREGGLSIGETVSCLQASLDALLATPAGRAATPLAGSPV